MKKTNQSNMIFNKPLPFLFCLLTVLFCNFLYCHEAQAKKKKIPGTQRPYIINNLKYYPLPSAVGYEEHGIASWYGSDFHGRLTSNGETYNMHDITAAHKLLPMHTMLLVQNLENGKQIVVRVNDRGPFIKGRIIDLSFGSAKKLGLVDSGTAKVKITALGEVEKEKSNGRPVFKEHADLRTGEYFVQIGAFIQKINAIELQDKFLNAGHKTVIREVDIKGQHFFRVQVYVGQTLNNARRSELALLDKGYRGAFMLAR